MELQKFSILRESLWGVYIALGLFGAAWIDFDFNELYVQAVAYLAIPVIAFYYAAKFLYPALKSKCPRIYYGLITTIAVILVPAHLLMINAATATPGTVKRDITRDGQLLTVATYRGGLGILYRKRW